MTLNISLKRGDTFLLRGVVTQESIAQDITDWDILCQVRLGPGKAVLSEAVVTKTSPLVGEYEIEVADTSEWPKGKLQCDIQYTLDTAQVVSTETFIIECIDDISRPVIP